MFWLQLAILVVSTLVYMFLAPKPKVEKVEVQQMDSPTASAGKPIPVLFGTKRINELNVIYFGQKSYVEREITTSEDKK
jgi:hypothetical protein